MSKFIELSDYDASIHRDILDALTRNDNAIVEICEDRAITEMRGYLSGHYDCDKLFAATGGEPEPTGIDDGIGYCHLPYILHPQSTEADTIAQRQV